MGGESLIYPKSAPGGDYCRGQRQRAAEQLGAVQPLKKGRNAVRTRVRGNAVRISQADTIASGSAFWGPPPIGSVTPGKLAEISRMLRPISRCQGISEINIRCVPAASEGAGVDASIGAPSPWAGVQARLRRVAAMSSRQTMIIAPSRNNSRRLPGPLRLCANRSSRAIAEIEVYALVGRRSNARFTVMRAGGLRKGVPRMRIRLRNWSRRVSGHSIPYPAPSGAISGDYLIRTYHQA